MFCKKNESRTKVDVGGGGEDDATCGGVINVGTAQIQCRWLFKRLKVGTFKKWQESGLVVWDVIRVGGSVR